MVRIPRAFSVLFVLSAPLAAQVYNPSGPQTSVPRSTVEAGGGWTPCFSSSYANWTGQWLESIGDGCDGSKVMLACSSSAASASLVVLAQGQRIDIGADPGDGQFDSHLVNGAEWYFDQGGAGSGRDSWGFAGGGDAVDRDNCDVEEDDPAERLCWHLHDFGGFRCGAQLPLNEDTTWVKRVYSHSPAIFDDDFETPADTCAWSDRAGSADDCSQSLTIAMSQGCGVALVDQDVHDLDSRVGFVGYRLTWSELQRESGYRVQTSTGATFTAESDWVEIGPGLDRTSVLSCEGSCSRTLRVMAHVGHPAGHGATAIAGDVVSNDCTVAPIFP
jgi:hypothetical protein